MSEANTCRQCGALLVTLGSECYCAKCLIGLACENTESPGENARTISAQTAALAGPALRNYDLLDVIGQGAMGVVYRARQKDLNRTVALKFLISGALASEAEIGRFRTEAETAATLQHPSIVSIHEVGQEGGCHFFCMEYVAGQTLAQVVNGTPIPAQRAARYMQKVAEAVHYAHGRGILHRDLKPANILIDPADQPRITDFGLAKQWQVESDLTASGMVLGTPSYMPPEQAAGRRDRLGPASDIYALGAVLYELLTGRAPFRAETPVDTLRQVLDTPPVSPRLINPRVPSDLETICLKCLEKEPAQRYATAQDFAEDLGRFLGGEPIRARPLSIWAKSWRWAERKPALASLTWATGVLVLTLAGASWAFRGDAMENLQAARLAATAISLQLHTLSHPLRVLSTNRHFLEVVRAGPNRHTELTNLLAQFYQQLRATNSPAAQGPWARIIENLVVTDAAGSLLARWEPEETGNELPNRGGRDYVAGAIRRAQSNRPLEIELRTEAGPVWLDFSSSNNVYHSRVFWSYNDRRHKFGVAQALLDTNRTILGVLATMVGTDSTDELLKWRLDRKKIVLVGQCDTNPVVGAHGISQIHTPFVIFWHPAYRPSQPPAPIAHPFLDHLFASDPSSDFYATNRYADRVASLPLQTRYSGRWLAGFARVPDTRFAVIYQTQDRVSNALGVGALLALLGVLCLFVTSRLSRRRWTGESGR